MEFRIHAHDSVDSTNESAFRALAAGSARHGDVHWAGEQTAGRGRRGASWFSARGAGVYLSVVLLPDPPALRAPLLTMAAGVAVVRAARGLGLERAGLKWPNDVVVDGAKLAGVLVETRGLDPEHPHYVVGIGVNVTQREFPKDLALERAVTSFALQGLSLEVECVRDLLLAEFAREWQRTTPPARALIEEFLDLARLRDARVALETQAGTLTGRLRALTLAGGLEVESTHGGRTRVPLEHVRSLASME